MISKRFSILSLAGLVTLGIVAAGAWQLRGAAPTAPAPQKQLYRCPMHPQIVQDHPGRCPICGMNLVPVQPGTKSTGAACPVVQGGCCGTSAEPGQ